MVAGRVVLPSCLHFDLGDGVPIVDWLMVKLLVACVSGYRICLCLRLDMGSCGRGLVILEFAYLFVVVTCAL